MGAGKYRGEVEPIAQHRVGRERGNCGPVTYEGQPARVLTVVRLSIERKGLLKPARP